MIHYRLILTSAVKLLVETSDARCIVQLNALMNVPVKTVIQQKCITCRFN